MCRWGILSKIIFSFQLFLCLSSQYSSFKSDSRWTKSSLGSCTSNWEVLLSSLLPKLRESAVSPVRDTRKFVRAGLSCASRFGIIDGDSCMVYVACPLRPTRLRLALFATTVLQSPPPRFRPSSPRSPRGTRSAPARCARLSPPLEPPNFTAWNVPKVMSWDRWTNTVPRRFCNGAFRGEICLVTGNWCTVKNYILDTGVSQRSPYNSP